MRVVVIGASGNVGTSVLRALATEPEVDEVLGLARRVPHAAFPKTTWAACDVARDDIAAHLRGADAVVHLAWLIQPARDLETMAAVNVTGSERVFAAVADAGVPALVYASSVGAYSAGPKDRTVDESWPTDGIPSSTYSRHKSLVERMLDRFEAERPGTRVVRLRPGLIFKREAGTEVRRFFAGPFLPRSLVRAEAIPVVPRHPLLRFQAVHSLDVGDAYRRALVSDARGAFNIAADPVLDGEELGRILGARPVPVPAGLLRGAADVTFRLRLQPTDAGWVDLGLGVPLMSTERARRELGWTPERSAGDALLDLIAGMREGAGEDTPPLDPATSGPLRAREILSGVGGANFRRVD